MVPNLKDDKSISYTSDMMAGPILFGAIGFAVDFFVLKDGYIATVIGLVVGLIMSLYAVFIRYKRDVDSLEQEKKDNPFGSKAV